MEASLVAMLVALSNTWLQLFFTGDLFYKSIFAALSISKQSEITLHLFSGLSHLVNKTNLPEKNF